jgi:predicted ATPase
MRDAATELLERDEHLRRLRAAFALRRQGRGRIVAIAAEAGAGKTALMERFAADHAGIARIYRGACENLSTPEVLLPLRDIARANGESFDVGTDHIRAFESLLRILSEGAVPSLLVIEDVHWADTATMDLIRFLGRRIARVRSLILITYRDEEVDARSPLRNLLGDAPAGNVERMTLAPLSLAAVTELAVKSGRHGGELFALTAGTIFWAAPTMTSAHLIFALVSTAYILIAIRWEERDLVSAFGNVYVDYRKRTPMLIPRLRARPNARVQRDMI